MSTVYFHAPDTGEPTPMIYSLTVVVAVILTCCGLVWLMPRNDPARHSRKEPP